MKPVIGVYLFEGYSDWEISYVLPELKKLDKWDIAFITETNQPVVSKGGMRIIPTMRYADLMKKEVIMMIIPGGTIWETNSVDTLMISQDIKLLYKRGCIFSAIGGGTILMGRAGLLTNMMHTSNDLNYLKAFVPNYTHDDLYLEECCITDYRVITANGIAPIEFAKAILYMLRVETNYVNRWYNLFKFGIRTAA